jgi:hypothetical protein
MMHPTNMQALEISMLTSHSHLFGTGNTANGFSDVTYIFEKYFNNYYRSSISKSESKIINIFLQNMHETVTQKITIFIGYNTQ